jgi:hypothetical protein
MTGMSLGNARMLNTHLVATDFSVAAHRAALLAKLTSAKLDCRAPRQKMVAILVPSVCA